MVALVGMKLRPEQSSVRWVGFPADAPRQDGFIEPGRLTYDVIDDVKGGNGLHARLHVSIQLNHDRIFLHSIENCLSDIDPYSLDESLIAGVPAFVESFVESHLAGFNGTSCVASVKLIDYELYPQTTLLSRGIQRSRDSSVTTELGEQSDAPESASRGVSKIEDQSRGTADR